MEVTAEHMYPLRLFNSMLGLPKENQATSDVISANHGAPVMMSH